VISLIVRAAARAARSACRNRLRFLQQQGVFSGAPEYWDTVADVIPYDYGVELR
jgi:hypothetical protein